MARGLPTIRLDDEPGMFHGDIDGASTEEILGELVRSLHDLRTLITEQNEILEELLQK